MPQSRDPVQLAQYVEAIQDRLGLEEDATWTADGPLIDLRDVALLGGLAVGTPSMARQRTAQGRARVAFPDPDPAEGMRWPDKPLFRAYVILDYFQATGNWPLGQAARPALRHPRTAPMPPRARPEDKITWTKLCEVEPELAERIKTAKLNDGSRRSPEQWRHRYEHTSGDHHEVIRQ